MGDEEKESLKRLSVVIPARNERDALPDTVRTLHQVLEEGGVPHQIIVVDDGSTDDSWEVLEGLAKEVGILCPVRNEGLNGFGRAIIRGFEAVEGDAVVIFMADQSDSPADVVNYWRKLNEGYDCVFGSRFIAGSEVIDYPRLKFFLNRFANFIVKLIFNIRLNDTTNAFKAYRTTVIHGCRPLISPHFNLTVELPLKAIVRGFTWTVIPISWRNRTSGTAKFRIKEMGSRYFFICAYVWLEKYFSRGDYKKR